MPTVSPVRLPTTPPITPPTNVPSNLPQPGTPGGGAKPTGNEDILALVPAGLEPIAVFPPFLTPRRALADAVIFKEPEGTVPVRRSYDNCPAPSFMDKLSKNIRCFGTRLKQRVKEMFGKKKDLMFLFFLILNFTFMM